MCSFKSIYFVIFILNLYETYAEISDKRLCRDPQCNEPVSLARTLLRYSSPDSRILSFAPNAEVTIYSKEAGSETSLWGAEIKGKRGYIPKHLVREYKVYKKPTLLVDTELKQSSQVPKEANDNIDPNSVKKPYEVVDGTTIYLNPQDSVNPSSTESPVLSTSLPIVNNVTEEQRVSVDVSKEKDVSKKGNEQESIVDSVLSSLSNLMGDDPDSEEFDVEDDEDDDEDDEDEEDSLEEEGDTDKETADTKIGAQDINSLHNLPPGVKISPYSLEIDQPLNGTIDMSLGEDSPQASKDSELPIPPPPNDTEQESDVTEKETIQQVPKHEDIPLSPLVPSATAKDTEETSATPKAAETVESEKVEADPVIPEKVETPAENKVQLINEPDTSNSENSAAATTEPSIEVEEEPLPILEEVTTSKPLDPILKETLDSEEVVTNESSQEVGEKNLEIDSSLTNNDEIPDTSKPLDPILNESQNIDEISTTESSQNVEEKNLEVDSSIANDEIPDAKSTLEEPTTTVPEIAVASEPSISDNTAETQNPNSDGRGKSFVPLPPLSLFSPPTQNEVHEENNETENEDKKTEDMINDSNTSDDQSDAKDVSSKTNEAPQQNSSSESPDASEDELTTAQDQIQNNLPKPEEITESFPDEEIVIEDDEVNKEEQIEEETSTDSEKEPENDDTDDNFELPQQQSTEPSEESGSLWSGLFSFFGGSSEESSRSEPNEQDPTTENTVEENVWVSQHTDKRYCDAALESCNTSQQETSTKEDGIFDNFSMKFSSDFFLLLVTTAGSVIVFLFVYMVLDRHRREAPLVARINKLEKELLVTLKENEILEEKGTSAVQEIETVPNEIVEQLTQRLAEAQFFQHTLETKIADLEKQLEAKAALEEHMESLEKELETSTEVGMELNRIISEMLDPTNGSDRLKENVEQLQRQLLEQKDTINSINETLRKKEAENRALRGDLERSKKVTADLQTKAQEVVEQMLKIEKEKDQQQTSLQKEITVYQQKYNESVSREEILNNDNQIIRMQLSEVQKRADIKTKEYQTLKESLDKMKPLKNNSEALKALLDSTSIKAEIQQLKIENTAYAAQLQQEQAVKAGFEKKYQAVVEEMSSLRERYELADKEKVEVNSKLEVLNNYFKKRESELQEEIIRYKSIWDAKEGEATSTTERMRYLQEEIESYKAQNETLKQEIISQEIDLKSQISVLEKKVHENWVTARQTERKLEDARQEAAQLRNRLTLRERTINEERIQNRLQSPLEQNGELPLSPRGIDSPASPPLLYGARDHITKSPPLPGMPPFLPPPPGAPFMPPPLHGMPPFMPPPPSMFPGDHRPPPLGRMSSPPLNSRYSPDTSAFSPYDRNSPSPPYDSEYGASPPPMRGYSPYSRDDRRDYKRPPPHARTNGRNAKGSVMSSGSDHSNDSLDKINRKQSKMV